MYLNSFTKIIFGKTKTNISLQNLAVSSLVNQPRSQGVSSLPPLSFRAQKVERTRGANDADKFQRPSYFLSVFFPTGSDTEKDYGGSPKTLFWSTHLHTYNLYLMVTKNACYKTKHRNLKKKTATALTGFKTPHRLRTIGGLHVMFTRFKIPDRSRPMGWVYTPR